MENIDNEFSGLEDSVNEFEFEEFIPTPPVNSKKNKKYNALSKKRQEKIKDIYCALESKEDIPIHKDAILSSFLDPHEKSMLLNELIFTNFNVSYEQSILNYIPILDIDKKTQNKACNLIALRNQKDYLTFEKKHELFFHEEKRKKEITKQLKSIKKIKNKINNKAKKLPIFKENYVKQNLIETFKNIKKDNTIKYYQEEKTLKALLNLIKRRLDIDMDYEEQKKQFIIKTQNKTFTIDFFVSINNSIGNPSGVAYYGTTDNHRKIEIIKSCQYDGFLFQDIQTLFHEIGHCIDDFSFFYPYEFNFFNKLNLSEYISFEKDEEVVSVFFEYLLLDQQFLKDIEIHSLDNILFTYYAQIMTQAYFTGNICRSLLRKKHKLQYIVKENNFANFYINNHYFHALLKFHENNDFNKYDWYCIGHLNALKKLKEHFPDIYHYFK